MATNDPHYHRVFASKRQKNVAVLWKKQKFMFDEF